MTIEERNNIGITLGDANTSIESGLALALQDAFRSGTEDVVVVCGSAYIMAYARKILGINEPNDNDVYENLQKTNIN